MVDKIKKRTGVGDYIDCACLIHHTLYDWTYVDKLYNSLCRNLTPQVRMHVYTESNRFVPSNYIRHDIEEWEGIRGPKSSWWYKVQLFNSKHWPKRATKMLYFDLDTVIVGNIDWLWQLDSGKFWAPRDFKYLMKSSRFCINSSIMWFDPKVYHYVYKNFDLKSVVNNPRCPWHGDQDYIYSQIKDDVAFYDTNRILSYRWQAREGGYDFRYRKPLNQGGETVVNEDTSVLIFHGEPKPHNCNDPFIFQHWR